VSVLVVPDVAPGMIPESQFVEVGQAPVPAVELQTPLAAIMDELAIAMENWIANRMAQRAGTLCRQPRMPMAIAKRSGAHMMPSFTS
jgi:hypothetical protein